MHTPISGLRAYLPTVGDHAQPGPARRTTVGAQAAFSLDLAGAVTPDEAKALAESFGAPRPGSPAKGDPRGRHLDVLA